MWDIGKRECVQTIQELNHTDQVSPLIMIVSALSFRDIYSMQIWGVALSGGSCVSVGDDGVACVYSALGRA